MVLIGEKLVLFLFIFNPSPFLCVGIFKNTLILFNKVVGQLILL